MKLLAVLSLLLGACAGPVVRVAPDKLPDDYESSEAEWRHDLHITAFSDYEPGEYSVISSIADRTAIRYMFAIRVFSDGVRRAATQVSPDGTESESLKIRLREGPAPDRLYADFEHSVRTAAGVDLRFAGTTVLLRP